MQAFFMASKSVTAMDRLVPSVFVPVLPGAINSVGRTLLWASFHASACSRPPDPNIKMFMKNTALVGGGEYRSRLLRIQLIIFDATFFVLCFRLLARLQVVHPLL